MFFCETLFYVNLCSPDGATLQSSCTFNTLPVMEKYSSIISKSTDMRVKVQKYPFSDGTLSVKSTNISQIYLNYCYQTSTKPEYSMA